MRWVSRSHRHSRRQADRPERPERLMKSEHRESPDLLCPSAQPDWPGAIAIGVVGGTTIAPRVANLERHVPVTDSLLALTDLVLPTEVFRFAAPCINESCRHHRGGVCH